MANQAINNQTITATTEEARQFYLPDSADNNCKNVEMFGESTQATRSGKNVFDITNIKDYANCNYVINKESKTLTITFE